MDLRNYVNTHGIDSATQRNQMSRLFDNVLFRLVRNVLRMRDFRKTVRDRAFDGRVVD